MHSVHDLHIWTLASGRIALSAHLEVHDLDVWPKILEATEIMLHRQFNIDHVTLQPEVQKAQGYAIPIRIYPK